MDEEWCESFSCESWHSFDVGEHLLQHDDFLLGESVDVLSDAARGDFPQDLGGSSAMPVELAASPEALEDAGFSLLGLETDGCSSW